MSEFSQTLFDYARVGVQVVALALGIGLTLGLAGPWGWVLAMTVGGALTAATCSGVESSVRVGSAAGMLGAAFAVRTYRAPRAINALSGWHVGYSQGEVHGEFLAPLIRSSVVNGHWGRADVLLIVMMTLGVAAVAALGGWLVSKSPSARAHSLRIAFGTLAVTAIAAALVLAAFSGPFRLRSTHALPAGTYRYDAAIYMNTYFNVLDGTPYYESIVKAASGDSRVMEEGGVRDGKFYGWAYSPAFIRMPWTFQIWRLIAPNGQLWYVSLFLCVAALYAVWWGLYAVLGVRAALVPPILFPLLMMATAWVNMYFPDWWAALAILFSVVFQIRRRYVLAGVLALLAGVFRDVALIWLAILLVNAAVLAWRGEARWRRLAVMYAVFMMGFFLVYFAHLRAAAPFVAPQPNSPDIRGRLAVSAVNNLDQRFFAPAAYMMVAYGSAVGRRALFVFAQIPGWWLVLRREKEALWPVLAFSVFWIAFTLTIGATSSYWGQVYTPVAVMGTGALFAWATPRPCLDDQYS